MAFGRTMTIRSISRERPGSALTLKTAKISIITTMSTDTTTTINPSRLLALPPELRNKIWEYTMKGGKSHPPIPSPHSPPPTTSPSKT